MHPWFDVWFLALLYSMSFARLCRMISDLPFFSLFLIIFSALTLLVVRQEGIKNWLVGCCREWGADLCTAQLMPLPLSVSCFSEIRIGLPFWYRLTWVVLEKGPLNGCMFLTYLLPNLSFSLRIDLVRFQAGCYKRRLNQAFVFLCLFCVVVRLLWLVNACFCRVLGLVFSIPSQEIGFGE